MLSNILQFKKQINYFFTGDFNYTRLANSDLISQMTRPNGVTSSWNYEDKRNLLTQVQNGSVSDFGYTNNAIGNRTAMSRAGSAFTTPDTISYSYNSRSEVIGAVSNQNSAYNYAYSFDSIGNRLTANLAGPSCNYTTNMLNQYTVINSNQPTYDDDGNMLTNDGWTYTWNGENRMVQAVNGNTKLQFTYDNMGRRIEKKVFDGDTVVSHKRFVYDNYKQVEELDALNSNSVLKRYSWQPEAVGLDVPLSMTDVAMAKNYAYTLDANKNVSDLTDAQGNIVAHYEYSPFGTHTATGSYTGNQFRFSSEVFDSETGLIYYNYRYYNPNLGRWINRDPIEEQGGWNLYCFLENDNQNFFDCLGMSYSQAKNLKYQFDKLNPTEITLILTNPYDAYQVYKSKKEAEKASKNMPGEWNGTGDAYRHCVWNCEMAKKIGQDEAKKFADAHEDEKNGNCYETTMDLHNNAIGRELAKNAETDCANACRQALNEGKLRKFDVDYNKKPKITGPMALIPTQAF